MTSARDHVLTIGRGDTLRTSPRCLLTELGDGTGVVLDLDTKFYFTLNRTGVAVWKELAAHAEGTTAEIIAKKLEVLFDVAYDEAVEDVVAALASMASEGLVQSFGSDAW